MPVPRTDSVRRMNEWMRKATTEVPRRTGCWTMCAPRFLVVAVCLFNWTAAIAEWHGQKPETTKRTLPDTLSLHSKALYARLLQAHIFNWFVRLLLSHLHDSGWLQCALWSLYASKYFPNVNLSTRGSLSSPWKSCSHRNSSETRSSPTRL